MNFQNKYKRPAVRLGQRPFRRDKSLPTEIIANPNRPKWLNKLPTEIDIVFFDLETTGGNPQNSAIIEIAAIKFSQGKEIARFETLVNPGRHIPSIVQKITGLNNEQVKNAPFIEDIFDDIIQFIGDSVLVAHGALGDIAYLIHHMRQLKNKEFENFYFCTHLLVTNLIPEIPSKSLSGIAEYYNIPVLDAHNALGDAIMTAQIFWKILKHCNEHGFKTCDDLFKIQGDLETFKKLGPGINPSIAENLPTTPGLLYVLNSHHEISFITATANIKKSLLQLTEVGLDKEMNRIVVDASGFKFERTSNLLDSLIREKKELKRISLSIDPRKNQSRSENFLQIFIPKDMLEFAREHPNKLSFFIPQIGELHTDYNDLFEDDNSFSENRANNNLYATFGEQDSTSIPITKTRRLITLSRSEKFKIRRDRLNHPDEPCIRIGHLKEGTGFCFGPFAQPKAVLQEVLELANMFPFEHNTFTMHERFNHLRILVSFLNGNLNDEIERIEKKCRKINSIKSFSKWLRNLNTLKEAKSLKERVRSDIVGHGPKSGMAIISNNDFKEFEVVVVVRGKVSKKLRLPFEQGERLKSARYFTRLFENHYNEIILPLTPIVFTDDICSDMELFSYWLQNKKGEGEWIEFKELEPLFNTSLL